MVGCPTAGLHGAAPPCQGLSPTPQGPAAPPGDPTLVPNPRRGLGHPDWAPHRGVQGHLGLGGSLRGSRSRARSCPGPSCPQGVTSPVSLGHQPSPLLCQALLCQRPLAPVRAYLPGSSQDPASLGNHGATATPAASPWAGVTFVQHSLQTSEHYNIFIFHILEISCFEGGGTHGLIWGGKEQWDPQGSTQGCRGIAEGAVGLGRWRGDA